MHGEIVTPRGALGFGYDPMFRPDGHARTFGEMSPEEKHGIDWASPDPRPLSHRARAFVALARGCLDMRAATSAHPGESRGQSPD